MANRLAFNFYGTVTADNFNLFGHSGASGATGRAEAGLTDIVPSESLTEILSLTLANNGGPTQTHALVAGSPAIDAVTDGSCPPPADDQRGVSRPGATATSAALKSCRPRPPTWR